jgi:hypothetical protein
MRKSLITITVKVEAFLPDNLSSTEFAESFPQNIHDYGVEIIDSQFESEIFLERDP